MEEVFTNYDILFYILDKIDIYSINSLSSVSKLFNQINNDIYHDKLYNNIIEPTRICFENYQIILSRIIISYNISNSDLLEIMLSLLSFLKHFFVNNYWIALVNDFELMEEVFIHLVCINNWFIKLKSFNNNTFDNDLYETIYIYIEKLKKYLYVENTDEYTVNHLKAMAKFKNIKLYYKMTRPKLIKVLTRPVNERYYINS